MVRLPGLAFSWPGLWWLKRNGCFRDSCEGYQGSFLTRTKVVLIDHLVLVVLFSLY